MPPPVGFDEGHVLQLMEFMALSRGDAIRLLAENGGNVEQALAQLLA